MISSRSSSGRRARRGAVALAVAALGACRHGAPADPAERLLAVFPVQNASGGSAPIRSLTEELEAALAGRGLRIVPRQDLDQVLAKHRIRFTGGVDRRMARVLREELQVDAVLVPTLELYAAAAPPKVAMAVRLVEASMRPVVLWADAVARTGDDSPGLLGLGLVETAAELEKEVVADLARAVARHATGRFAGDSCGSAGRFRPRRAFRAPVLDDVGRQTIAVLPFANETSRRDAGDVVLEQFVAQLARSGSFDVLDPGVVREELLANRIVLEGGVSVDGAMAILDLLQADLVLTGDVQVYAGPAGKHVPPSVAFTAYVLDRVTGELVWSSASDGAGNDGVFFFGAGRVHTTSALSCRMVRGVVDRIVGGREPLVASGRSETVSQGSRWSVGRAQHPRGPPLRYP
jgi:TolB-like protein